MFLLMTSNAACTQPMHRYTKSCHAAWSCRVMRQTLNAAVAIRAKFRIQITSHSPAEVEHRWSGQTYGSGIIIDVSKFHNQIIETKRRREVGSCPIRRVRDVLNQQLAKHQASLRARSCNRFASNHWSGMVGNKPVGHAASSTANPSTMFLNGRVLLSDGTICHFKPREPGFWKSQSHTRSSVEARG